MVGPGPSAWRCRFYVSPGGGATKQPMVRVGRAGSPVSAGSLRMRRRSRYESARRRSLDVCPKGCPITPRAGRSRDLAWNELSLAASPAGTVTTGHGVPGRNSARQTLCRWVVTMPGTAPFRLFSAILLAAVFVGPLSFSQSRATVPDWKRATEESQRVKPPARPAFLKVRALDSRRIRVTWRDRSTNESGFQISNGKVTKKVRRNAIAFTWGGLAPGKYMCFKVRAYNKAGSVSVGAQQVPLVPLHEDT